MNHTKEKIIKTVVLNDTEQNLNLEEIIAESKEIAKKAAIRWSLYDTGGVCLSKDFYKSLF